MTDPLARITRASSHPQCVEGHVCQEPSGRICIEVGCFEAAGTWWGPLWCPAHDKERLDRVSAQFEALADAINGEGEQNNE